ncbi:hypothetical protein L6472_01380 [Prevotella sp. E13-17]|uniref:hypothetical protein n=1 Tax=Prevotella sp. E13-17 TaxID=2913616 RepID=UPI001EDAA1DE|nr:hypothetical protein [Prevotella sp. E13-17]UKK51279.1 hypothetical protein L6472_01380 [Prevotella sp. E13-17]
MRTSIIIAMSMMLGSTAFAQEKLETTVSSDIVSSYIWRGQDLGSVSAQPALGVSYKGLSLTAWSSVGLSQPDDTKEFDLTLGYTLGRLNIGITDYWFNDGLDPLNRYFRYDAHSTNHLFEANIGYDFGVASVQWFMNFAGNDGAKKDGKRAYSSYLEFAVPFKIAMVDWTATAGAVPFATTFYGTSGFAITNLSLRATKAIDVTPSFTIPVFAQVTANPCSQKAFLAFGITLHP